MSCCLGEDFKVSINASERGQIHYFARQVLSLSIDHPRDRLSKLFTRHSNVYSVLWVLPAHFLRRKYPSLNGNLLCQVQAFVLVGHHSNINSRLLTRVNSLSNARPEVVVDSKRVSHIRANLPQMTHRLERVQFHDQVHPFVHLTDRVGH